MFFFWGDCFFFFFSGLLGCSFLFVFCFDRFMMWCLVIFLCALLFACCGIL